MCFGDVAGQGRVEERDVRLPLLELLGFGVAAAAVVRLSRVNKVVRFECCFMQIEERSSFDESNEEALP